MLLFSRSEIKKLWCKLQIDIRDVDGILSLSPCHYFLDVRQSSKRMAYLIYYAHWKKPCHYHTSRAQNATFIIYDVNMSSSFSTEAVIALHY